MDLNYFPLVLSLKVAFAATLISTVLGILSAYFLNNYNCRLAEFIETAFMLPVILPPTVLGYYLLILLGRQSLIGLFLEKNFNIMLVFTPAGAVIAASFVALPFIVKTTRTALAANDPDIIHAAQLLGRTDINIFATIILPLAWRGILSGMVLAFARALGDFGTTLMVAGNIPNKTATMPIAIYDALIAGNKPMADLLVAIMTATALIILFLLNHLEKNWQRSSRRA